MLYILFLCYAKGKQGVGDLSLGTLEMFVSFLGRVRDQTYFEILQRMAVAFSNDIDIQ